MMPLGRTVAEWESICVCRKSLSQMWVRLIRVSGLGEFSCLRAGAGQGRQPWARWATGLTLDKAASLFPPAEYKDQAFLLLLYVFQHLVLRDLLLLYMDQNRVFFFKLLSKKAD